MNFKLRRFNVIIFLIFVISGALGFSLSWSNYYGEPKKITDIVQRRESYHYPALFVKQLEGDRQAGKKIFYQFCAACHHSSPVIQVHAPLINDKKIWQIKSQMGMSSLLKLTTDGIGAMPARGGCFECSDEQLRKTIQYMLDQSLKN